MSLIRERMRTYPVDVGKIVNHWPLKESARVNPYINYAFPYQWTIRKLTSLCWQCIYCNLTVYKIPSRINNVYFFLLSKCSSFFEDAKLFTKVNDFLLLVQLPLSIHSEWTVAKASQKVEDVLVLVQLLLGQLGARVRNPGIFDSNQQVSQFGREFYLEVV